MEHRGMKSWSSEELSDMGYNSWLREEAQNSLSLLNKNTARLLAQLSVLQSVLLQEEISSARLARVLQAQIHLMTEIHLLVTLKGQEN